MKIYADRLPVAIRQLITDLLVVIWVYVWIRAGLWVHDLVLKLGVPGQKLESAGSGIADNLADAGGKVGRVPLVGDQLTKPFTGAAGPATGAFYASLDDAGKATLRDTVRASLPEGPFTLPARAWLALGTVPG